MHGRCSKRGMVDTLGGGMMVPNERHFCIWNGVTVRDSVIANFFQAVVDPERHCFYVRWVQAGICMIAHSHMYVRSMDVLLFWQCFWWYADIEMQVRWYHWGLSLTKWRNACGFCAGRTMLLFWFTPRVVFVRQGHRLPPRIVILVKICAGDRWHGYLLLVFIVPDTVLELI